MRWKSWRRMGPSRPAVNEFWLSSTGEPLEVVRIGRCEAIFLLERWRMACEKEKVWRFEKERERKEGERDTDVCCTRFVDEGTKNKKEKVLVRDSQTKS
jgi:hypothetical protein